MKDQTRNLNPHKLAVAAMWLYGHEYSTQSGGSMDFWDKLPMRKKANIQKMVHEIENARPVDRSEMI